jgi:hypothetical protein
MANNMLDHTRLNFNELWVAALHRYQDETGRELSQTPYFTPLISSSSADDVCRVLQDRGECLKAFRARGEKIRAVLAPIARLVQFFVDAGAEAASATVRFLKSTVFTRRLIVQQGVVPGGKAIFVAFGVLLQVYPSFHCRIKCRISLRRLRMVSASLMTLLSPSCPGSNRF